MAKTQVQEMWVILSGTHTTESSSQTGESFCESSTFPRKASLVSTPEREQAGVPGSTLETWDVIHLQGTLSGSLRCTLNRFQPGSVSSRHELPEGQKLDSGGSVQSPWSAWSATSPGLMTGSLPTAAPQCDLEHCSFSGFVASKSEF